MGWFGLLVPTLLPALLVAASAHAQKHADGSQTTAWLKLCENAISTAKSNDDKQEKKSINICLTYHERLDSNTGMVLVSAAVRQIDGQERQHFMVMVPLGMLLQRGVRVSIFPNELWERVQKNEEIKESDEAGLSSLTLAYTLCHAAGCTAEVEASPDLLISLKSSGGFVVRATGESGTSVAFSVPLNGFAQALEGAPFTPRTPRTPMRCDRGSWPGCTLP